VGNTLKPSRCRDCGKVGGHYQWCGVKHLDDIESMGLSAVVADLRKRHPEVEARSATVIYNPKPTAKAITDLPTWQKPSLAGSYNVISSPAHYARFAIQPIDFIEANGLDFLQASVLKYLVRFPFKNGVEDLHKARDMLNRLIAREEAKLVRDAGDQVGGDPAAEDAERGTDRGGRAK
jgi:hypothetical protein